MAIPVFPVTGANQQIVGAPAIRVRLVNADNSEKVDGGSALRVYYVSDAEVAAGLFKVEGRTRDLPVYEVVVGDRPIQGGSAIPVYVSNISASPSQGTITYLLYDAFMNALAAGAVNGTLSTPPPGYVEQTGQTRTVTDTNSKLSITGGVASFATGGVGAGDPGLWYAAVTRALGRILIGTFVWTGGNVSFGWDQNQAGNPLDGITFLNPTILRVLVNGATITVGAFVADTSYQLAAILRASGGYVFIKGGTFTNWSLLWQHDLNNNTPMYPALSSFSGTTTVATLDNIRVPVSLYIPTPLAFSSFGA